MTNETLENQLIKLIAVDRIEIPISSLSGKLKRAKPKLAKALEMPESGRYRGERVYARIETENEEKARGMREGIEEFAKLHQQYGKILNGLIEQKRTEKETHLYFGMNDNCRLTSSDYMSVMTNLGFSETRAESLYGELMDVSRNLSKKRGNPERSIMLGTTLGEDSYGQAEDA